VGFVSIRGWTEGLGLWIFDFTGPWWVVICPTLMSLTQAILQYCNLTHGLHLNSRGKTRLTHLMAESICGGHVPSMNSSIPVITHTRASPFCRLRSRAHRCLIYIECSNLSYKCHGKIVVSLNSLNIFHQNIRGLKNKSDELIN
jgi:hypothetical protein